LFEPLNKIYFSGNKKTPYADAVEDQHQSRVTLISHGLKKTPRLIHDVNGAGRMKVRRTEELVGCDYGHHRSCLSVKNELK